MWSILSASTAGYFRASLVLVGVHSVGHLIMTAMTTALATLSSKQDSMRCDAIRFDSTGKCNLLWLLQPQKQQQQQLQLQLRHEEQQQLQLQHEQQLLVLLQALDYLPIALPNSSLFVAFAMKS